MEFETENESKGEKRIKKSEKPKIHRRALKNKKRQERTSGKLKEI